MTRTFLLAVALAGAGAMASVRAADSMSEARALYDAASYEEALAALGSTDAPEAQEYRGLCLMALGRTADAERTLEALVAAAPSYALAGDERPPRFVAMFTAVRQRVLPGVARGMFASARSAFQAKDYGTAMDGFDRLESLVNDPAMKDVADTADLRLLVAGFLQLARAAVVPPSPAPAPAVEAKTTGEPPKITRPAIVRQMFPPVPTAISASGRTMTGAIKFVVGPDGRVKSAAIVTPVHPLYDLDLLAAARIWLFTPASINGSPVEGEVIVPVQIAARR